MTKESLLKALEDERLKWVYDAGPSLALDAAIALVKEHLGEELPTEEMCDKARWFILARDAGITKWGKLDKAKPEKTIPLIEMKILDDPEGHITKWDFAECVYLLMQSTTPAKPGESEGV